MKALHYVPRFHSAAVSLMDLFQDKLRWHEVYARRHFEDLPEIRDWRWEP